MMREWTIWIAGMLGIASIFVIIGAYPILKEERARETDGSNRVLTLATALILHATVTVFLPLSPFAGWMGYPELAAYIFWAVLGVWLVAKLMIVTSTSPYIRLTVVILSLWSLGWWTVFWTWRT